jgi:hypothetical protein
MTVPKKVKILTDKNENKNYWNTASEVERNKPKFIPKGRSITVFPNIAPEQVQKDGRFGKQLLYVVDSDIGKVYLNPVQIIDIANRFGMQVPPYSTPVTFP